MQGGDLVDIPDYMQSLTLGTKYLNYLKICTIDLAKKALQGSWSGFSSSGHLQNKLKLHPHAGNQKGTPFKVFNLGGWLLYGFSHFVLHTLVLRLPTALLELKHNTAKTHKPGLEQEICFCSS